MENVKRQIREAFILVGIIEPSIKGLLSKFVYHLKQLIFLIIKLKSKKTPNSIRIGCNIGCQSHN